MNIKFLAEQILYELHNKPGFKTDAGEH